jgi:hypothetical protein
MMPDNGSQLSRSSIGCKLTAHLVRQNFAHSYSGRCRSAVGESRPTSHFFEAEFLLAYRLGNNGEQLGKHPLEQLPGPIAIGAGRIRAHRRFDAKMRQLALTALEPLFNFPQPIRLAQFAKKASWRNDSNSTGFCNGTATQFLSRGAESRYAESARVLG